MFFVVVIIVNSLSRGVTAQEYDYCNPDLKLCKNPTEHTMCKFPNIVPKETCLKLGTSLTHEEKVDILDTHNELRSKLAVGLETRGSPGPQPSASNMREMIWDNELEIIATRWANQCIPAQSSQKYDICRNVKRFRVSQNVGLNVYEAPLKSDLQLDKIVQDWYDHVTHVNENIINKYPGPNPATHINQFVKVAWAESYLVGCGIIVFIEDLMLPNHKEKLVVAERLICNYGPEGGIIGKQVYKIGAPAADCGTVFHESTIYKGLCADPLMNLNRKVKEGKLELLSTTEEVVRLNTTYHNDGLVDGDMCYCIGSVNSAPSHTCYVLLFVFEFLFLVYIK